MENDRMPRFEFCKRPSLCCLLSSLLVLQMHTGAAAQTAPADSSASHADAHCRQLQRNLARGWNTWDVNSMTTYVLLPEGLGTHVGFFNEANDLSHEFLRNNRGWPGHGLSRTARLGRQL
jgi:hypothetical protein